MTRSAGRKPLTKMNAKELAEATAEFEQEFVADSFGPPSPEQRERMQRARRKRGRPKSGKGAKVISVSIEQGLLEKADRLARKLSVPRAALVMRGLQAIVDNEIQVHPSGTG